MYDLKVSYPRLMTLHPAIREEAIELFERIEKDFNVLIRCVYGKRTWQEQDALYQQGRSRPGAIVTNARSGYSYHNYGLALDFCLLDKNGMYSFDMTADYDGDGRKDWLEVAEAFKSYEWEWGGDWKSFPDFPHVQKTFGLTIETCRDLWVRQVVDGTGYIVI